MVTRRACVRGLPVRLSRLTHGLREDLASAEEAVQRLITVRLNDNQFSALCSFAFNVGSGALSRSTLRRVLNEGDYGAVSAQLARWVKAGGKTLRGLVRRECGRSRTVGDALMPPSMSGHRARW